MNPARNILLGMLRMNLEQAWELLQNDDCDLAIEHLNMATEQVGQIKDVLAQAKVKAPQTEQRVLGI